MSADNSNNSTPISQARRDRVADTSGRAARAAQELLNKSGVKPEKPGRSGQSRRPFNRDRDNDPSGKNLQLDKAAGLLGFDMGGDDDKNSRSSRRADRSKRAVDDDGKRRNEGGGASHDGQGDEARNRANRPALELDDEDDSDAERRKKSKVKTVADYASEAGVDAKSIYDLTVAFDENDGVEPMTIGAMKDRIKEVQDFERRRDEHEDWRTESMNEVLSARQQIDGVMQRIMQVIPREQLETAFGDYIQQHQGRVAEARKQLREYFPEWNDANVMQKDRDELDSHLETYGFTKFEIDNMQDARLIRYAVHAMRLMGRYQRMKEDLKKYRDKVPTVVPSSRRSGRADPTANAKQQAASGDKVGAVASLIRR